MNYEQIEILIVDDSDKDTILMERELQKARIANSIMTLRSGEDALDFLFRRGAYSGIPQVALPRVVFLDLRMPGMSGLDVLKQLRLNELTIDLPVVIFTSSAEDPDISQSYRLGANSYVVKPVSLDQMRIAMQSLGWYWLIVNLTPSGTRSGFMQNGER